MRFALVTHLNGKGLQIDAELLSEFLTKHGHETTTINYIDEHPPTGFDIAFFLEVVPQHMLHIAKRLFAIPNIEWMQPDVERLIKKHMDKVFAKTYEGYRVLSQKFRGVHYIGFLSRDRYDWAVPRKRQFLHLGGGNGYRNSSQVLEAWRSARYYDGVPAEDTPLVIVSNSTMYQHEETAGVTYYKRLEDDEIKRLQNESLFHIYPSATEGWGHVQHEALSVGAVLLVSDLPPMNEIKVAIKIPISGTVEKGAATLAEVSPTDIRDKVNFSLKRFEKGAEAFVRENVRQEFIESNEEFAKLFLPHLEPMPEGKCVVAILGNFTVPHSTENDWAYSFEALGHQVFQFQEDDDDAEFIVKECKRRGVKLFLYIHTHSFVTPGSMTPDEMVKQLREAGIVTVSPHLDLYWGLNQADGREDKVGTHAFFKTDYVMTADGSSQDKFKARGVNHIPMMPGVKACDCYEGVPQPELMVDVCFVGAGPGYHPEWPFRGELIHALQDTYGDRFRQYNGFRGDRLNNLYASAKVCVADCCFAGKPYYVSDRWTETCGRGGFLLAPQVEGVCIPLATFKPKDINDMLDKVDYYLTHDAEREMIRKACHEHVKNHDTYTHRAAEILKIAGLK